MSDHKPRDEGASDPTEPGGRPLRDLDEPESTVSVTPDEALHNDPRRVVHPRTANEHDPTKNVLPASLAGAAPLPPGPPVHGAEPSREPTVAVTPDLAVVNDPNRVFAARAEAQLAPTVNVVPDLAVHNDPNRIFRAREEAQDAPTKNVVPDPGVYNDPNRLLWVRDDAPDPPTVNAVPELPQPPVPSGLLWVRDEPETPQTVNTVPGTNVATVRTDPDPTAGSSEVPWEVEPEEEGTKKLDLDLPVEARVLTSALNAFAPPRPSAARTQVPLGGDVSSGKAPTPAAPAPRLSPPHKAPVLDGVAPLKPLGPPESTLRTDPATAPPAQAHAPLVPLSALANVEAPPESPDATAKGRPPVEAWRESTAVRQWQEDERDQTKIMPAAARPGAKLRPPRVRDLLVLALGFALLCAGMVLARRQTDEGLGPAPAEKIKPPADYVAPTYAKATAPYESPEDKARRYTTVDKPSSSSPGGSPAGGAASPAAASSQSSAAHGAPAPTSSRLPVMKCQLNVPAALETQAKWVVEGKKKLLRLRATPKRQAIQKANLFIAMASHPEHCKIERMENAAVYFEVFLEPEPKGDTVRVVLDCECGIANAEVMASIDKKTLEVDLKYAKVLPPEVIAAKARKKR